MRLPPFRLEEPQSVPEAIEILARPDGEARVIAGGTALVPTLRLGLVRPARLVSLHGIPELRSLRVDGQALEVGATVTVAALARHHSTRADWPLLAHAAGCVATLAIRSTATVGGNLCYGEAASDLAPALLCLEAQVRVGDSVGERVVPVTELFKGFYETAVEAGEIATGLRVPAVPREARTGYVRFCPRSAEDKPLIGVAGLLVLDAGRRVSELRLGLGGAAPTPKRARRAEAAATGQELGDAMIRTVAEAAAAEAEPLSDLVGSADYRREMIRVWVRRLLVTLRDGRAIA